MFGLGSGSAGEYLGYDSGWVGEIGQNSLRSSG